MTENPRVALVTGATSGIGLASARLLAEQGHRVFLCARDATAVADTVKALQNEGLDVDGTTADVRSREQVAEVVRAAVARFGPIDVLVNNAGVQVRSIGIEADDDEWDLVTAVNQRGVFLGMRATIPSMLRAGGGSIVNISSVAALIGQPGSIPYQASKSAVLGLTRGAALSYGPRNIRVNAICPGLVITPMTDSAAPDAVQAMKQQIPLGRDGRAEEISAGVVFLASDESSFITGVALPIDGGMVIV